MKRAANLKLVRGGAKAELKLADRLDRSYRQIYHANEVNRCPGCGQSQWWVGRSSAECAFCGALLPIVSDGTLAESEPAQ